MNIRSIRTEKILKKLNLHLYIFIHTFQRKLTKNLKNICLVYRVNSKYVNMMKKKSLSFLKNLSSKAKSKTVFQIKTIQNFLIRKQTIELNH